MQTSNCLDKCKQGPVVKIEMPDGTAAVCVSKDKSPKKAKKDKLGNNIVSKGSLSRESSLVP